MAHERIGLLGGSRRDEEGREEKSGEKTGVHGGKNSFDVAQPSPTWQRASGCGALMGAVAVACRPPALRAATRPASTSGPSPRGGGGYGRKGKREGGRDKVCVYCLRSDRPQ
jgi:hypothetical protein